VGAESRLCRHKTQFGTKDHKLRGANVNYDGIKETECLWGLGMKMGCWMEAKLGICTK